MLNSLKGGEITMKKEQDASIEEQQEDLKESVLKDLDNKHVDTRRTDGSV